MHYCRSESCHIQLLQRRGEDIEWLEYQKITCIRSLYWWQPIRSIRLFEAAEFYNISDSR